MDGSGSAYAQVMLGLHVHGFVFPHLPSHLSSILAASLFHTSVNTLSKGGLVGGQAGSPLVIMHGLRAMVGSNPLLAVQVYKPSLHTLILHLSSLHSDSWWVGHLLYLLAPFKAPGCGPFASCAIYLASLNMCVLGHVTVCTKCYASIVIMASSHTCSSVSISAQLLWPPTQSALQTLSSWRPMSV